MCRYDVLAAADHDWNGGSWNNADPVFSISFVSFRETNAKVHTISWNGAALGGIWTSCHLLSEKCQSVYRQPRDTGRNFRSGGSCVAFMEKTDVTFHCRRNGMLYAFDTICVLNKMAMKNFKGL